MRRRNERALASALALLAVFGTGCSRKPQPLPLAVRRCDAVVTKNGISFDLGTRSSAKKPIGKFSYEIDFGGSTLGGLITFSPPLEPGQSRDVTVQVKGPTTGIRPPTRCVPVRIVYADGTVDEAERR
jgi:hypothetical protein